VNLVTTIVVAITTMIVALAASVPVYLTGRQQRDAQNRTWERQDKVAEQAAEAARLLSERQDKTAAAAAETARLLLAANERVAVDTAAAAAETNGRLGQIHELVNSNLTAELVARHAALVQQAILMREVVRLNEAAGRHPDTAALAAIEALDEQVAELGAKLRDRASATVIADTQRTDS
jgi:hypothetical protein